MSLSLGGRLAARFAISQQHRLRRLVLVAPGGLRVPDAPMEDIFRIPPEQIPGMLVKNFEVLLPWLPTDPRDLDFAVDRQAKAWAELVPDSDLRLFDDAGHLLLDESPEAVKAVAEFCK